MRNRDLDANSRDCLGCRICRAHRILVCRSGWPRVHSARGRSACNAPRVAAV